MYGLLKTRQYYTYFYFNPKIVKNTQLERDVEMMISATLLKGADKQADSHTEN